MSAERAHAASVRDAEEAAVRKVRERQRVEPRRVDRVPSPKDARRQERIAQRELDQEEGRIGALEAQIAAITATLEDPALYTRDGGVAEATRLGAELEVMRRDLDAAMARWAAAAR